MINVKDFRIGNFILIDDKPCRINLLNNDPGFSETPCVGYESKDDTGYEKCTSERVQPLPVTEDWINRFESGMEHHVRLSNRGSKTGEVNIQVEFSQKTLLHSIKYLHALQNLFFVLAGEELSIQKTRETA
jgi:hypothetical protein